jgi:hypothetical protein
MKDYIEFITEYGGTTFYDKPWSNNLELSKKQFNKLLKKCKWFDFDDNEIFRSVNLIWDYYLITPKMKKLRKSANVPNYYTLLMNDLPSWDKYPTRTHICSNVEFDYNTTLYRVIPFDKDARIGICPNDDVQADFEYDAKLKIYGIDSLDRYSDLINSNFFRFRDFSIQFMKANPEIRFESGIRDKNWRSFRKDSEKMLDSLRNLNMETATEKDKENINMIIDLLDVDKLNELFNPEDLGFKSVSYKKYKNMKFDKVKQPYHMENDYMHEIWLDCPILLIKNSLLHK